MWLSRLRTQHSVCEDVGSIPGLAQWVMDLVLPQAAAEVADAVWIRHCCGCGVGHCCSSDSTLRPGSSICHKCGPKKKKREREINKQDFKSGNQKGKEADSICVAVLCTKGTKSQNMVKYGDFKIRVGFKSHKATPTCVS